MNSVAGPMLNISRHKRWQYNWHSPGAYIRLDINQIYHYIFIPGPVKAPMSQDNDY